jgi:serine/threonine protein kinase
VKPGNILIAADGTAKIADFGIAKSLPSDDEARPDLTATGQVLGTPAYLAPERLDGSPATPRSDLWALGVVLYEALAGRKPFEGPSPLAVARAVADGTHVPLGTVRPDLDPRLVAVVERAMAAEPAERFATADEMAGALTGWGAADTVEDVPRPDSTLVLPATVPPRRAPRPVTHGPVLWKRRSARVWTLVALAVVALLFLIARPHGPNADLVRRSTASTTVASTPATTATTSAPVTAPARQPYATVATTPPAHVVQSPFVETHPAPEKAKGKGGGKDKG